jgi:hypothetical protein
MADSWQKWPFSGIRSKWGEWGTLPAFGFPAFLPAFLPILGLFEQLLRPKADFEQKMIFCTPPF